MPSHSRVVGGALLALAALAAESPAQSAVFTFESMVQDLGAVVDDLELETCDLIGLAHGGPVAMSYAARNPQRVRKLILVNPSERILKLLKLAKLDAVFNIYSTEEEAIAAESGGGTAKTA